ncbi:MAG TPA: hypothetical protein ENI46_00445 [Firmicutes bacterium]|nr:hypothetical protein [Bacillota bacterium]
MRSLGLVVGTKDGIARIALGPHVECSKCGACLAALDNKARTIEAVNEAGAKIGQRVEIEIKPSQAVATAFLIFVLPLVAAIGAGYLGLGVGEAFGVMPDYVAIIFGIAGFVGSMLILRFVDRRYAKRMPVVVRIAEESLEGGD